jgi:hypothetical protein
MVKFNVYSHGRVSHIETGNEDICLHGFTGACCFHRHGDEPSWPQKTAAFIIVAVKTLNLTEKVVFREIFQIVDGTVSDVCLVTIY